MKNRIDEIWRIIAKGQTDAPFHDNVKIAEYFKSVPERRACGFAADKKREGLYRTIISNFRLSIQGGFYIVVYQSVVYYTLDANKPNIHQLLISLESLRKYNNTIPVFVFISENLPSSYRNKLIKLSAKIIETNALKGNPFYFRWKALSWLSEYNALYLDTDTFISGDIEKLFESSSNADFSARIEWRCDNGTYPVAIWRVDKRPQIDHEIFERLCSSIGRPSLPIFNTGVMILKNNVVNYLIDHFHEFNQFRYLFISRLFPYPCENTHIIDEVVASLVLAGIKGLKWKALSRKAAPFYMEYKTRMLDERGIAMHVWGFLYPSFLYQFFNQAELVNYLSLGSNRNIQIRDALNVHLPLGSFHFKAPSGMIELWLKISAISYSITSKITKVLQKKN